MSIKPVIENLPLLSRMARAALHWTQEKTAEETGVPKVSLARFESLTGALTTTQLGMLIDGYEDAGITFHHEDRTIGISLQHHTAALSLAWIEDPESRRSDYKGKKDDKA